MSINLEEYTDKVNRILAHSQNLNIDMLDCSDIINTWFEKKARFIEAFGGSTRIKLPQEVVIELPPNMREKYVNKFVDKSWAYHRDRKHSVVKDYCGINFWDFIFMNKESFFDNEVTVTNSAFGNTIVGGMKLSKAFKYFIEEEEHLRAIQDMASTYMQRNKTKGYLYLSVDPLDFLSSSENKHNWRSCHALDGEYRAGNLSYMCDDVTIVTYLAGECDDKQLKAFPEGLLWNSKKWRMLVYCHPENHVWYYGRQYPFDSSILQTMVYKNLKIAFNDIRILPPETIGLKDISTPQGTVYLNNIHFHLGGEVFNAQTIVQDADNALHYNDIVYSHLYLPSASFGLIPRDNLTDEEGDLIWDQDYFGRSFHPFIKNMLTMTIGSKIICPIKGCDHVLTNSELMVCRDCDDDYTEEVVRCVMCGCRIYEDETIYYDNWGGSICYDCHKAEEENR